MYRLGLEWNGFLGDWSDVDNWIHMYGVVVMFKTHDMIDPMMCITSIGGEYIVRHCRIYLYETFCNVRNTLSIQWCVSITAGEKFGMYT